jgi:hypothetical protein
MKKIGFVIILLGITAIVSSCRKEHITPVNQLVKDLFCFKTGSEWTYYDSVSQTTQKILVTNYEATRLGYPKPYGKTRDWGECIEIDFIIENSKGGETVLNASVGEINTAKGRVFTPTNSFLSIYCNENNIFKSIPTYIGTYMVNETTYPDVYVFNEGDVTYYVSKHIGFIRCVKNNDFDLVLIDKNVQQ